MKQLENRISGLLCEAANKEERYGDTAKRIVSIVQECLFGKGLIIPMTGENIATVGAITGYETIRTIGDDEILQLMDRVNGIERRVTAIERSGTKIKCHSCGDILTPLPPGPRSSPPYFCTKTKCVDEMVKLRRREVG